MGDCIAAMMKICMSNKEARVACQEMMGQRAKTRRQVDNAVCWLQKRYFTEEVRAKKRLNESQSKRE